MQALRRHPVPPDPSRKGGMSWGRDGAWGPALLLTGRRSHGPWCPPRGLEADGSHSPASPHPPPTPHSPTPGPGIMEQMFDSLGLCVLSVCWARRGLHGVVAVAPPFLTGLVSLSDLKRVSGGIAVCSRVRSWGAPALTQEEVLVLVVVGQVLQLLLAVLRKEQRS